MIERNRVNKVVRPILVASLGLNVLACNPKPEVDQYCLPIGPGLERTFERYFEDQSISAKLKLACPDNALKGELDYTFKEGALLNLPSSRIFKVVFKNLEIYTVVGQVQPNLVSASFTLIENSHSGRKNIIPWIWQTSDFNFNNDHTVKFKWDNGKLTSRQFDFIIEDREKIPPFGKSLDPYPFNRRR